MLTERELISKCQSSFQLLAFMVVIYKDEGATMDFCMNDCACHSQPAIRKMDTWVRSPKTSFHALFETKMTRIISGYIRIK